MKDKKIVWGKSRQLTAWELVIAINNSPIPIDVKFITVNPTDSSYTAFYQYTVDE